jgi:hypothetical protein
MTPEEYGLRVWTSGGRVYHESESCPRGGATPSFWGFAVDAGLSPCGKCATSFEEVVDA